MPARVAKDDFARRPRVRLGGPTSARRGQGTHGGLRAATPDGNAGGQRTFDAAARPASARPIAMSFDASLAATVRTFEALATVRTDIDRAGEVILRTLREDRKLLIFGNGGSAAEAMHFATELAGRYFKDRRPLPALALTEGSLVTCIGNDYGFDTVFARQIAALGRPGDLAVAISSSGNSRNLVLGLEAARRGGLATLALLGRGGGAARPLAEVSVVVPGDSGRTAQEAHLFLIHLFCDLIDAAFA